MRSWYAKPPKPLFYGVVGLMMLLFSAATLRRFHNEVTKNLCTVHNAYDSIWSYYIYNNQSA